MGRNGVRDAKDIDINAIRESLFIASRKYLADTESRLRSEGIKVKTESLEGTGLRTQSLSTLRKRYGYDHHWHHGNTGLKKLMLGSVAFGVLHQSHIPVLLIRPESCDHSNVGR